MRAQCYTSIATICMVWSWMVLGEAQVQPQKAPVRLFNTAKQKLSEGKQIVGATVFSPDSNLLRHGKCRIRLSVDRDAAQPSNI